MRRCFLDLECTPQDLRLLDVAPLLDGRRCAMRTVGIYDMVVKKSVVNKVLFMKKDATIIKLVCTVVSNRRSVVSNRRSWKTRRSGGSARRTDSRQRG